MPTVNSIQTYERLPTSAVTDSSFEGRPHIVSIWAAHSFFITDGYRTLFYVKSFLHVLLIILKFYLVIDSYKNVFVRRIKTAKHKLFLNILTFGKNIT